MIIATEHLQPGRMDAFADRELPPDEARAIQQHLAACHPCALQVLATLELKQATAEAGRRLDPSSAALARLTAQLQRNDAAQLQPNAKLRPNRVLSFPLARSLWTALAALLLVALSLTTWSIRRTRNALSAELAAELSAELLDQHLATLSAVATPQVLSTDRHTVKPWFEGKLPFSFNLPEPTALPPGTILKGADLTYLGDHPAAQLLFAVGKHQVSVFVAERDSLAFTPAASTRSGFNVRSSAAGDLQLIAVGDIDPPRLDVLLASLATAQPAR